MPSKDQNRGFVGPKRRKRVKKKEYLFAADDVVLLNDLVNDGGIRIGDEPEAPGSTRLTVLHDNGVRYLAILFEIIHKRF